MHIAVCLGYGANQMGIKKLLPKRFDVDVQRPSVLLFGNGMVRCFSSNPDWTRVIEELAVTGLGSGKTGSFPYSIRATVTTDPDDETRRTDYINYFENVYQYHPNPLISDLVGIPFDAFLTTNYTYELEYALMEDYPGLKTKQNYAHSVDFIPEFFEKDDPDRDYNLNSPEAMEETRWMRSFNSIGGKDIWHIHGEIRRRNSFILTHDEYGRLMGAILKYNKVRGKNNGKILRETDENGSPRKKEFNFCSWFDYFIYGDLYILGQGFDFSEFDLWWLISRRQRTRLFGSGRAVFLQPLAADGELTLIEQVLSALGVEIEHCGVRLSGDEEKDKGIYREFYIKATAFLKEMIKEDSEPIAGGL